MNNNPETLQTVIDWLCGDDTGLSSKCIARTLFGYSAGDDSYPRDSGDFGRCCRFFKTLPDGAIPDDWKSQMAAASKEWAALIPVWDRLTELYEAKDGKALYAEIVSITNKLHFDKKSP